MFCRICGKQILDDSNFCQYCGMGIKPIEVKAIYHTLIITPEEAKKGFARKLLIEGRKKPLVINIPSKTKDGQVFRIRRIKLINSSGEKIKKDIFLKVEIKSGMRADN